MTSQDCIYVSPRWEQTIRNAIDKGFIPDVHLQQQFRLALLICRLPQLNRLLQQIESDPTHPDTPSRALYLATEASAALAALQEYDDTIITFLQGSGGIILGNCDISACSKSFNFSEPLLHEIFTHHAWACMSTNSIVTDALDYLGLADRVEAEAQNRAWATRVWRSYPYAQRFKPLASIKFVLPAIVSYEWAGPVERRMIEMALNDVSSYRRPPPGGYTEAPILANAKAVRGKIPFVRTQDIEVEIRGEGARS